MRIASYFQLGNQSRVFSFVQDSAITLLTKMLTILLTLGVSVVISRALGPTVKGTFDLLILLVTFSSLLVLFGLDTANVYFGARKPHELDSLVGNSILAAIVLGAMIMALVEAVLYLPPFQTYLVNNGMNIIWMRWMACVIPLVLLNTYLKEIIRAAGHIIHYNAVSVVQTVAFLSVTSFFVLGFHWGFSGAVLGWVVAQLCAAVYILWLVLQITHWQVRVNYSSFKRSFQYGLRLYPGEIAQFLNYRVDVFLVAFFLTPASVGLYTVATSLAERLWEIPHAIRTVLLQRISKSGDQANEDILTLHVVQLVATLIALGCIGLATFAYPIVNLLFGQAYRPAVPAVIALMPGVWALSIGKLLATHLSARGYPQVGTYGALTALLATLVLDLLLIPRLGITGAAIASSVAYTLATLAIYLFFQRITGLKFTALLTSPLSQSKLKLYGD